MKTRQKKKNELRGKRGQDGDTGQGREKTLCAAPRIQKFTTRILKSATHILETWLGGFFLRSAYCYSISYNVQIEKLI
jgi:hypothetical protein